MVADIQLGTRGGSQERIHRLFNVRAERRGKGRQRALQRRSLADNRRPRLPRNRRNLKVLQFQLGIHRGIDIPGVGAHLFRQSTLAEQRNRRPEFPATKARMGETRGLERKARRRQSAALNAPHHHLCREIVG